MTLLTTHPTDRARLDAALAAGDATLAVAFCAQWCSTCREFRPALARLAAARPDVFVLWLDVEDDADLLDDLELDTFPTLAIYGGATLRHYGPVLPQASLVERLLSDRGALRTPADVPTAIADLLVNIARV